MNTLTAYPIQEQTKAIEIASALGVDKRVITRRASRENWPFVNGRARGGHVKIYPTKHLPGEIRIALAKHRVTSVKPITGTSKDIGAEAFYNISRAQAEQKERDRIKKEKQLASFAQVPAEKQETAYARHEILLACDGFLAVSAPKNKKKGIAEFCTLYNNGEIKLAPEILKQVPKTSLSTILRWQRKFKVDGMMGLVNRYRNPRKGTTSLTRDQQHFTLAMIKERPHATIKTVHVSMQARFNGTTPHISSLRRFMNRWKEENQSLFLYITNPDAWRSKHQFAVGNASQGVERINQVWEFDSTPADVMLVDGRHCLIGVVDVCTRRFKLLVSKTSRSTAVAALTRNAILDWGVPEIAKTDNGADYVSRHIVQVFESLGIEQQLCPPFTPEAKPHIERAFKTFSHSFAELMPNYIGHNVVDRKAIEARRSFAARLGKKDETVKITMTAEVLQQYCDRWCEAIYHQNPHRGLDGKTPYQVARAWIGTERRISDERALDILLAEAPQGKGVRSVTKKGILVNRISYVSDELAGLEGKQVRVKLDPMDLGTIYLFDRDGKFICIAHDHLRIGIDPAKSTAKLIARQKEIVREGSRQLKKIAREQAVSEMHDEILAYRESKIPNIFSTPKPFEEYSTKDLDEAAKAAASKIKSQQDFDEMNDILVDTEPKSTNRFIPQQKHDDQAIPLFASDADRYNWIKTRGGKTPGLTSEENDWLSNYYATKGGRIYLELEGDLRSKIGLQAERAESRGKTSCTGEDISDEKDICSHKKCAAVPGRDGDG